MIIIGSPNALFPPDSPMTLGVHGEKYLAHQNEILDTTGWTAQDFADTGIYMTLDQILKGELLRDYIHDIEINNRPDWFKNNLINLMPYYDLDASDVAKGIGQSVEWVNALLSNESATPLAVSLKNSWAAALGSAQTFMQYGHSETSAKYLAAVSLLDALKQLNATEAQLAQAVGVSESDVAALTAYAKNRALVNQAQQDETDKYMQMQEEAIAQKAANEAAERRNSVLSWYASNQDANKNPSEADIAYWTNQLVVKPYDTVFADFTGTVAAYVEQQRIAAANAAAEQQALETAKARELVAIAAAKSAASEAERMAAEQAAAVEDANIAVLNELRRKQDAATVAQLAEKAKQDEIAAKAQADALAAAAAAAAAVTSTTVTTQVIDSKLTLADDAYAKSALESQRALVRGWYADNPCAIKNPSAKDVDYWATQLDGSNTTTVFNNFSAAVYTEYQKTIDTFGKDSLPPVDTSDKTKINPLALLAIASYFFTG